MSLINSVNLIILLENKISTTKKNDSMQKMNVYQYYRNIYSQHSKNISVILFINKV
jgi:hypothetical protein